MYSQSPATLGWYSLLLLQTLVMLPHSSISCVSFPTFSRSLSLSDSLFTATVKSQFVNSCPKVTSSLLCDGSSLIMKCHSLRHNSQSGTGHTLGPWGMSSFVPLFQPTSLFFIQLKQYLFSNHASQVSLLYN